MATAEMAHLTFAESLRAARCSRGMTQRALARALRISPSVVSLWESGRRVPDVEMAATIARVLNTSVQELVSVDPVVPASKFVCMPCNSAMQNHSVDQFECPACKYTYDANHLRTALDSELAKASELLGLDSPKSIAQDVHKVLWTGKISGVEFSPELEKQMTLALEQEKLLQNLGFRNPTRTARLLAQIATSLDQSPQSLTLFERILPALKSMLLTNQ